MKSGHSMQDIASELKRQLDTKADFVVDTRELAMFTRTEADSKLPMIQQFDPLAPIGQSMLTIADIDSFVVTDYAHGQIAGRLQIPKPYYDRIRTKHPALLDTTVNTLMYDSPERRLVRTLDGEVRAFLSDTFLRMDHWDVMQVCLPLITAVPDFMIVSAELTDTRMYIKAVFPRITAEVRVGDIVQAGVVIKNSEVGAGRFEVSPLIFRLDCLNGMISQEGVARRHVGKRIEDDEEASRLFSDEAKQADDTALWLKVRDVVKATIDEAKFNDIVIRLRQSLDRRMNVGPIEAVQRLTKKVNLTDSEGDQILRHLIEGGDLTQYGLIQAVTRHSQDTLDYDRATELEELGGAILAADDRFLKEIGVSL